MYCAEPERSSRCKPAKLFVVPQHGIVWKLGPIDGMSRDGMVESIRDNVPNWKMENILEANDEFGNNIN